MVVGFGQWGEMGYSQLFWSCIFIHVYFLKIINNILKICLLTNSDNGPVLAIVHPSNKIKVLLWTAYFWLEGESIYCHSNTGRCYQGWNQSILRDKILILNFYSWFPFCCYFSVSCCLVSVIQDTNHTCFLYTRISSELCMHYTLGHTYKLMSNYINLCVLKRL